MMIGVYKIKGHMPFIIVRIFRIYLFLANLVRINMSVRWEL
jgi:hypothetical protein